MTAALTLECRLAHFIEQKDGCSLRLSFKRHVVYPLASRLATTDSKKRFLAVCFALASYPIQSHADFTITNGPLKGCIQREQGGPSGLGYTECPGGKRGGQRCGPGEVVNSMGLCNPAGTVDCGNNRWCPRGDRCMRSGGCIPEEAVECSDGKICKAGRRCGSGNQCLREGETDCGHGRSCQEGWQCRHGGGCMPEGAVECGTRYCEAGRRCGSGDQCLSEGQADCGDGRSCREGWQCTANGCMPDGAVGCGDNGYCAAGERCGSGDRCLSEGEVDCGNGRSCSTGWRCFPGGGCMPKGAVACGAMYCEPGKVCGSNHECETKNEAEGKARVEKEIREVAALWAKVKDFFVGQIEEPSRATEPGKAHEKRTKATIVQSEKRYPTPPAPPPEALLTGADRAKVALYDDASWFVYSAEKELSKLPQPTREKIRQSLRRYILEHAIPSSTGQMYWNFFRDTIDDWDTLMDTLRKEMAEHGEIGPNMQDTEKALDTFRANMKARIMSATQDSALDSANKAVQDGDTQ
jgi:hypothetical protein